MKSLNLTLPAILVTGISFLAACSHDRTSPTDSSSGNISGAWVGTLSSDDSLDCDTSPAPAQATFHQNGSDVSGTLTSSASAEQCGFATLTFQGTLEGNSLHGILNNFYPHASANGALAGGTLSIQIVNVSGSVTNHLTLHR